MSINRNSNLIKAIQPQVERDAVSYNFSANIWAIGGGGGGQSATTGGAHGIAGGGGGAGSVVSSSLSVVPNITWTIEVGGGGTSDTNGQDTFATIYDDTYGGLVTLKAQGGLSPTNSGGGNQGSGSVETTAVTSSYTPFTGGAVNTALAGGGAGATQNGGDGNAFPNAGGSGGQGIDNLPFGGSTLATAGGGGGGYNNSIVNPIVGSGNDGGGDSGDKVTFNGNNATAYGAGGGGGSTDNVSAGSGGDGSNGLVMIRFEGQIGTAYDQYDIELTNATTSYNGTITSIYFNSGSGTFRYNAPFPYVPGN